MEKRQIEVHDFNSGNVTTYDQGQIKAGHGGGDLGIMRDFVSLVALGEANTVGKTSYWSSVQGHLMALAAEESRLSGQTVNFVQYMDRYISGTP
jgi:hypothetical protein